MLTAIPRFEVTVRSLLQKILVPLRGRTSSNLYKYSSWSASRLLILTHNLWRVIYRYVSNQSRILEQHFLFSAYCPPSVFFHFYNALLVGDLGQIKFSLLEQIMHVLERAVRASLSPKGGVKHHNSTK